MAIVLKKTKRNKKQCNKTCVFGYNLQNLLKPDERLVTQNPLKPNQSSLVSKLCL